MSVSIGLLCCSRLSRSGCFFKSFIVLILYRYAYFLDLLLDSLEALVLEFANETALRAQLGEEKVFLDGV